MAALTPLLCDLLDRGHAMVAKVSSVDRGNGATAAAMHLRKLATAEAGRG